MTNYQIEGPIGSMHVAVAYLRGSNLIARENFFAKPEEAKLELVLTNGASIKGFYDSVSKKDVLQFSGVPDKYLREIGQRMHRPLMDTPEAVLLPTREELLPTNLEDII